ncbi:restriction endonuclease [Oerskovia sp. NPDC060338]|uniref:restriction endonuclease n=1 Tax=Oerskovia sp. NPDC060338 TaxID=3347100 RepID=UPI0036488208
MSDSEHCEKCGHGEKQHELGWRCNGPHDLMACDVLCGRYAPGGVESPSGKPPATIKSNPRRNTSGLERPTDWKAAERFAAEHMRLLGFSDARVTPSGPDGGIDVIATGGAGQVKHYASAVGSPVVQQAHGVGHASRWTLVYALSGFTRAALTVADSMLVALFQYSVDGEVTPISETAHALVRGGVFPLTLAPASPAALAFVQDVQRYCQAVIDDALVVMEHCRSVGPQLTPREQGEVGRLSRRVLEVLTTLSAMPDKKNIPELLQHTAELDALVQRLRGLTSA